MRIHLVFLAALVVLILPAVVTGCVEDSCEGSCFDQYDDCLGRAPPGASKADCSIVYDSCLKACSSTNDAPTP